MNLSERVLARVQTTFKPRRTLDEQNALNLYGDIAWYGILSGIANSFLSVFTIRLGGSDIHVGLLSALPALITFLVSIPGSHLIEREKKSLSVLTNTAVLNRFGYLVIALVPLILVEHRADAIVAAVGLLSIPGAIASVAFTTMFARAVKPEYRAHVVSVRNVALGLTSTAVAFIGGKFLDYVQFPINYQILFAIGFVGSMVSAYYLSRLCLPVEPAPMRAKPAPVRSFDLFKMLRADDRYLRFVIVSFVFQWGVFFSLPLYPIFWVRNLHAADGWIGLINTISTGLTIFFYPVWARIAMRHGNRPLLIAAAIGLTFYPLATALAPSIEWIIVVSFIAGVFNPAYGLASFNGLLEVSPEENRSSYIAIYNTLINVASFAGPIISTSLIVIFGIQALLVFATVLRLIGAFLFWQQRVLTLEETGHLQHASS
jgi:MFS family permease